MDVEIFVDKADVEKFQITRPNIGDVLNKLKDVELHSINRGIIRERYIYNKDELSALRDKVSDYSNCTDASISIEDVTDYTFNITVEGKILDILGMFYHLGLVNHFNTLDTYLYTDLNLIDNVLRDIRFRYELSTSLIMKFLSEHNGNVNYNYILDIIRRDINKNDLKEFLPNLFKKLYGIKIEEAKIDSEGDKLSLTSIKSDNLKVMDDELHIRLDNRR